MTIPLQQLQSRFRLALENVLGDQVELPEILVAQAWTSGISSKRNRVWLHASNF